MLFFLFALPIVIAGCRHLIGATILVFVPDASGGIGLSIMLRAIPDTKVLIVLLVFSSGCALASVVLNKLRGISILLLLLPQQIFLVIAALGAGIAVWVGAYADGVPRSHWFILDDQLPRLTAAFIHCAAMAGLARIRR